MNTFALVGGCSFYTSCERVFRPDLIGQPIIVLSNHDGCVVARSAEAKTLDIPALLPFYQVQWLCHKHRVAVFSSNYARYGDMSRRMMNVIGRFAPVQEIYSIAECFLDVTGTPNLDSHGHRIRQVVGKDWAFPLASAWAAAKRWPGRPITWPAAPRVEGRVRMGLAQAARGRPATGRTPSLARYCVVGLIGVSIRTTQAALRAIWRKAFSCHQAGVILMDIGPDTHQQQDMFSPLPNPKRARLMAAINQLNRNFGSGTIRLGAEGLREDWRMRQGMKSPGYTTRIGDVARLE